MISSKSFSVISTVSSLTVILVMLTGCGCFPCGDDDTASSVIDTPFSKSYIQLAPIAPPPPMYEEAERSNNPHAYVWRPGYWDYSGSNYHWVSGELIARPSPTAVWSPDHWTQHTYGWGFVPGYWQ